MAVYLDASALVKLVQQERESDALRRELAGRPRQASSVVAGVEVRLAARRSGLEGAVEQAESVLAKLAFVALDPPIVAVAGCQDGLRALDAIHLASALTLGDELEAFVAYDDRLLSAATAHGLPVSAPA
jgi:predicted nucleic acid-binding protein